MKLLNIGFGNMVSTSKIVAVVSPDSAPIKRMMSQAKTSGKLVDATFGRKTEAVIITDSQHIILSALMPDDIHQRFYELTDKDETDEK